MISSSRTPADSPQPTLRLSPPYQLNSFRYFASNTDFSEFSKERTAEEIHTQFTAPSLSRASLDTSEWPVVAETLRKVAGGINNDHKIVDVCDEPDIEMAVPGQVFSVFDDLRLDVVWLLFLVLDLLLFLHRAVSTYIHTGVIYGERAECGALKRQTGAVHQTHTPAVSGSVRNGGTSLAAANQLSDPSTPMSDSRFCSDLRNYLSGVKPAGL